ncbi:MAG: hypothetical protein V3U89_02350 [Methylophilaceae bacterium]
MHKVFNRHDRHQGLDRSDDFSDMSELEGLIQYKEILSRVDFLDGKNLKGKVQLVLDIDEKAYRKIQSITHGYLDALKSNKNVKTSIEAAVYAYLRQLSSIYTLIVEDCQHQNKLNFNEEKISLVLARYLNTIFMMSKWRYFDDQPASMGTWSNVHRVIEIAENLSVLNKKLFLYDVQKKETSLAIILERGFMLDTLQKENYTPLQFELTDRVLKIWSSNPTLSEAFQKGQYQFFIHLDGENRPQRLRSTKQHPDFRYWKTTTIVDLIETYLCAADTGKPLEEFNLITMAAAEDLVGLFKKLRVDWCEKGYKRQRRKDQRNTKQNRLSVCFGVDRICSFNQALQVKASQVVSAIINEGSDSRLTTQEESIGSQGNQFNVFGLENWTMLEESDSGFSVELGKNIGISIQPGTLVGYAAVGDKSRIAIAEIKSVKKSSNGTHRVGLKKLANSIAATSLSRRQKSNTQETVQGYYVDDGAGNLTYSDAFSGLFIHDTEKLRVIVPQQQYKQASYYQAAMHDGEQHEVLAGAVVNSSHDWVCFEAVA